MSWGFVAAAGATVVSGALGASASRSAARSQSRSADRATELQREIFEQQRTDQAPWQLAGRTGLNALLGLSGLPQVMAGQVNEFTGANRSGTDSIQPLTKELPQFSGNVTQRLMADPGYQFRLQQGQQALDRSASARGGLFSGRAGKDLLSFGQGLGSQEYGNAWNRMANIAGIGQTANTVVGAAGQNFANQAGQNMIGAGNARASGYINQANAIGSGINQLGQIGGYYFGQGNTPTVNSYNMPAYGGTRPIG